MKKDLFIFFGIFFLAALIRLPFISHPAESVFDEHFQHVTISNVHHGMSFFDVHPPLFTLLLEGVAHLKNFAPIQHGDNKIKVPFGDFPYYNLRFFVATAGSLLPAIIFLIARLLAIETPLAVLPALFVLFDNALIIYSRTILPDTILLFFGFLGIAIWLLSKRAQNKVGPAILFFLALVSFGAAASIKWTGFGFLGIALLYEAYYKNIKRVVLGLACVSIVYILIFVVFFARLTGDHIESVYKIDALNSVHFSPEKNIINFSQFFIQYHRAMIQANKSYDANFKELKHPLASKPYQWPFNEKILNFWVNTASSAGITLSGNFPAWIISLLAVVTLAALSLLQIFGYTIPIAISQSTFFLLGGFLINYVPFFFIGRSLFIYHYFSALIFSYLTVPLVLRFWSSLVPHMLPINRLVKIFVAAVILWYVVFIPRIYGTPYPFGSIQKDMQFDTMAKTQPK